MPKVEMRHVRRNRETGELETIIEVAEPPKLAADPTVMLDAERLAAREGLALVQATCQAIIDSGRPTPAEVASRHLPDLAIGLVKAAPWLQRMAGAPD